MSEAAALALPAYLNKTMNIQDPTFLTDWLVSFLNKTGRSRPPHWNIKFFTQEFLNHQHQNLQGAKRSELYGSPSSHAGFKA